MCDMCVYDAATVRERAQCIGGQAKKEASNSQGAVHCITLWFTSEAKVFRAQRSRKRRGMASNSSLGGRTMHNPYLSYSSCLSNFAGYVRAKISRSTVTRHCGHTGCPFGARRRSCCTGTRRGEVRIVSKVGAPGTQECRSPLAIAAAS